VCDSVRQLSPKYYLFVELKVLEEKRTVKEKVLDTSACVWYVNSDVGQMKFFFSMRDKFMYRIEI
jgi:hypothetical protein